MIVPVSYTHLDVYKRQLPTTYNIVSRDNRYLFTFRFGGYLPSDVVKFL